MAGVVTVCMATDTVVGGVVGGGIGIVLGVLTSSSSMEAITLAGLATGVL